MFVLLRSAQSVMVEERGVLCSKHAMAVLQLMQFNSLRLISVFLLYLIYIFDSVLPSKSLIIFLSNRRDPLCSSFTCLKRGMSFGLLFVFALV